MSKNDLIFQALKKILTPREINYELEIELWEIDFREVRDII